MGNKRKEGSGEVLQFIRKREGEKLAGKKGEERVSIKDMRNKRKERRK